MGRVPRRAEPWHLAPARVTTGAPTERGVTPARPMRAHGSTTGWSAGSRAWTAPTDSVILARRFHGIWLVYISAPLNRQRGYVRATGSHRHHRVDRRAGADPAHPGLLAVEGGRV